MQLTYIAAFRGMAGKFQTLSWEGVIEWVLNWVKFVVTPINTELEMPAGQITSL